MNVLQSNLILKPKSSDWMSFYRLLQHGKPRMLLEWPKACYSSMETEKQLKILSVPKFIFSKGICGTAEFRVVPIQAATCLMRPSFVPILSE